MATAAPGDVDRLVSNFLGERHQLLIGGQWVDAAGGEVIESIDPSTGRVIASVAAGGREDIDRAVAAARKAFEAPSWAGLSPNGRAKLLWRLADAIEADAKALGLIESLDNGMPIRVAGFAGIGAAETLRYCAGWCGKLGGETLNLSTPGHHAYTLREPVGVVGAIVPWNFPLAMAVAKLAQALAAGCTVVLKPAELTSLSTLRLGRLLSEVGFPDGVVNIVTGHGHIAGQALAEHPGVDKISFTGSTATGRRILAAAAQSNLKRVTLELGGKSPVLIFPDSDIEAAIDGAANGVFFNAGQVCVAGSRVFAHRSIFDRVAEGIAERAGRLKIGGGQSPDTQIGPLVSQGQRERVLNYIEGGRRDGGRVLTGGEAAAGDGFFVKPTVFVETPADIAIVREEIFGPVVCAMPFDDDGIDAIAAYANDTIYGLSASVYTRNIGLAHSLAKRIKAGTVRINGGAGLDMAMPFGGMKQSGWGKENGREGIEGFTEIKSVSVALQI